MSNHDPADGTDQPAAAPAPPDPPGPFDRARQLPCVRKMQRCRFLPVCNAFEGPGGVLLDPSGSNGLLISAIVVVEDHRGPGGESAGERGNGRVPGERRGPSGRAVHEQQAAARDVVPSRFGVAGEGLALDGVLLQMARLPEGERPDTWLTYGEQRHPVPLSHAFTTLGDTRRARESRRHALELSAPTSTMTRTLLNIDAAARSHHDGACRRAVAALAGLPGGFRTGLVRCGSRTLDLYEAIPAQHHGERAVRGLRDVLAA
ncbi:hypothetical protein ACWDDN_23315 [Streptomyces griseoruber]